MGVSNDMKLMTCVPCTGTLKQCWESATELREFELWSQGTGALQPTACRWKDVKCEGDFIREIWWGNRNIQGDLSRFAHLTTLKVLYLTGNKALSGDCKQILQLKELSRLDIRKTQVSCDMATLSKMNALKYIKLAGGLSQTDIFRLCETAFFFVQPPTICHSETWCFPITLDIKLSSCVIRVIIAS